jgi:hypothetical protein
MGFETEMREIPEKYKKELNDLIWKFLWDNKPNQIERNVKNVLKSSPLKPVSQYSKHVIDGP